MENQNMNEEVDQVTLTLEDDTELVCDIVAIFPCGEKEYIALAPNYPEGSKEAEKDEIFLYQFIEKGDDIELIDIEAEDEFEEVAEAFDEFMDSEFFDEAFGDDDEELQNEINNK